MSKTKKSIILVIGPKHGGTTITKVLLAQHPMIFGGGPLTNFPFGKQFVADNVCGCGKPTALCDFWQEIRAACGATSATTHPIPIKKVYSAILEKTQCAALVDGHQGVRRAFELSSLLSDDPDFRLIIMSVKRPILQVIGSQLWVALRLKRIHDDKISRLKQITQSIKNYQDILYNVRDSKLPCQVIVSDYKDICDKPFEMLSRICTILGLEYKSIQHLKSPACVLKRPSHLMRGNPRVRENENIQLKYNPEIRCLTRFEKLFALFINFIPFYYLLQLKRYLERRALSEVHAE
jgi:Sulfotransferase family